MSFARIFSDAFYNGGVALPQAYYEGLDTNLSEAVNGDGGGSWSPGFMVIAGAGMWFLGPTPLTGAGATAIGGAHPLTLGDSDYPLFTTGQTAVTNREIAGNPGRAFSAQRWMNISASPTFLPFIGGFQTSSPGQIVRVPLDVVHQAATLTEVIVQFSVGSDHTSTGVPAQLPRVRIVRVDASGALVQMSSTGAGADAEGFVSPATPGSGSAWYSGGGPQNLDITCDINNVLDRSHYSYWLEWVDESGTNAFPAGTNTGNWVGYIDLEIAVIADERPGVY